MERFHRLFQVCMGNPHVFGRGERRPKYLVALGVREYHEYLFTLAIEQTIQTTNDLPPLVQWAQSATHVEMPSSLQQAH